MCWGGSNTVPKPEWVKTGIIFHEYNKEAAFGLRVDNGATKAFQMILQAYILKHLMFEGKGSKKAKYLDIKPQHFLIFPHSQGGGG